MQSILDEITSLRNGAPITVDYHNRNRYRLVVQEDDGSKTAYYFSSPIYNQKTRKLIDVKFHSSDGAIFAEGSNAKTIVSENIRMENAEGSCVVELSGKPIFVSRQEIRCGNAVILPTTNGCAMKCNVKNGEKVSFVIATNQPFLNVRSNDKCFALMKERFRPFVVFSCVGCLDAMGNVIAPAKMEYQKLADKKYRITVSATSPLAQELLFEGNLYENKLFQDTTVESMNPSSNNAFGGAGFIGNTSLYGEQWLYSRTDYSRMPEIMDRSIRKVDLHIPKLNKNQVELSAFKVTARFCSFGSNWDNKIADGTRICDSFSDRGYQSLDCTPLLVDPRTKTLMRSEGLILKTKIKGSGFSVIGTGDSCYAPQILEVNFK